MIEPIFRRHQFKAILNGDAGSGGIVSADSMITGDLSLHHKAINDALQGVLTNGQHDTVTSSTMTTTTMTKTLKPELEVHHSIVDLGSGMRSTGRITELEDVPDVESIDGISGGGEMVLHHTANQSMTPAGAKAHVVPGQLQIVEQRHQNIMHMINGGDQQNIEAGSNSGMLQTNGSGMATGGYGKGRRGCKKGCGSKDGSVINTAEVLSESGSGPIDMHFGNDQMSLTTTDTFHTNEIKTDRFGNTIVDNTAADTKQMSKRQRRAAARLANAQVNGQHMPMPMHPPWGPPHPHPMGPPPHLQQQMLVATQQQQDMHSHGGTQGHIGGGSLTGTTTVNTMTQSVGGSTGGCKKKRCRGKNNTAVPSGAVQGAVGDQQNIEVKTEYNIQGDNIRHSIRKDSRYFFRLTIIIQKIKSFNSHKKHFLQKNTKRKVL